MKNNNTIKSWVLNFKSKRKCSICDYIKCISALELHHINPKEKSINITSINTWTILQSEIIKCSLLCCRCHREVHFKILDNPIPIRLSDDEKIELSTFIDDERKKRLWESIVRFNKIIPKKRKKDKKINWNEWNKTPERLNRDVVLSVEKMNKRKPKRF